MNPEPRFLSVEDAAAHSACGAQVAAGRQEDANRTMAQLRLLLVLVRIAEDMGYE